MMRATYKNRDSEAQNCFFKYLGIFGYRSLGKLEKAKL